jgi:DNA-binding response OmpR family regulator
VLLVDDDADIRDLLAVVLEQDGCEIAQAGDVATALDLLRAGGFQLVITDYELPDGSGGQLLGQAARERLLEGCAVLVVTGYPDPEDVGAAPVIPKPFDPDALRKQVRHILDRSAPAPDAAPPAAAPGGIELVLYTARNSPASRLAERNARRILADFPAGTARLVLRDVARHPQDAERDRILFVPTLVARCTPPVWVVGSLRNRAALLGILSLCGAPDPGRATS